MTKPKKKINKGVWAELQPGDRIHTGTLFRNLYNTNEAVVTTVYEGGFCYHADGYDYKLDKHPENAHTMDFEKADERGFYLIPSYVPTSEGDRDTDI